MPPRAELLKCSAISHTKNATGGTFTASMSVNRGQIEAADSQPGRVSTLALTVQAAGGQIRQINPDNVPLTDVKLAEAPAGGTVKYTQNVAWDGLDNSGQPISGSVQVQFKAELAFFPNGQREVLPGGTTGGFTVAL